MNGEQVNIRGSFTGKLSADLTEVTGTWTQTAPQEEGPDPLELKRQATPAAPAATAQSAAPAGRRQPPSRGIGRALWIPAPPSCALCFT